MRKMMLAAVLSLATVAGCSKKSDDSAKQAQEFDAPLMALADVESGLNAKQLQVVDCNSERTRKKFGHLLDKL